MKNGGTHCGRTWSPFSPGWPRRYAQVPELKLCPGYRDFGAQTWVLHRVLSNGALHQFPFPAVNCINYIINIAFLWARSAPNLSLALGETTFKFLSTKALIGFELHGSPKTQNVGTHTYVLPSIAGFDLLILHFSHRWMTPPSLSWLPSEFFLKGPNLTCYFSVPEITVSD